MDVKRHPGSLAALLLLLNLFSTVAHAIAVSGQGTWETTLQGRDLDGNLSTFEAYYDTALDITWLADANYSQTTGFDTDGKMTWVDSNAWAAALDPYGSGITGWRLPTTTDTGTSGCNFAYTGTDCGYNVDTATGEMAHMFHTTLGNLSNYSTSGVADQPGWGLTNTGEFSNIQAFRYWSATGYAPSTSNAWLFGFYAGVQDYTTKATNYNHSWAVHAGDVGTAVVPVPAAAWLFGSGLLGLVGLGRRRRR
jgi:hypothetical protein